MTNTSVAADAPTAEYEREIARIESTHLGYEDHGILTAYLHVTYGGAAQGLGGYDLRPANESACAEWIERTLAACGVSRWEDLRGRTIFVLRRGGRIEGIEPLPTERGERFIFADAMLTANRRAAATAAFLDEVDR